MKLAIAVPLALAAAFAIAGCATAPTDGATPLTTEAGPPQDGLSEVRQVYGDVRSLQLLRP